MLDQGTREAILQLHRKGIGSRRIAKLLACSRGAVRDVIARNSAEVPQMVDKKRRKPIAMTSSRSMITARATSCAFTKSYSREAPSCPIRR